MDVRGDGTVQTLTRQMGTGGNNVPLVLQPAYAVSPAFEEEADELFATECKDLSSVPEPGAMALRRLTPLECARLQGFPDGWCADLQMTEVDSEELAFWRTSWRPDGAWPARAWERADTRAWPWTDLPP